MRTESLFRPRFTSVAAQFSCCFATDAKTPAPVAPVNTSRRSDAFHGLHVVSHPFLQVPSFLARCVRFEARCGVSSCSPSFRCCVSVACEAQRPEETGFGRASRNPCPLEVVQMEWISAASSSSTLVRRVASERREYGYRGGRYQRNRFLFFGPYSWALSSAPFSSQRPQHHNLQDDLLAPYKLPLRPALLDKVPY